MDSYQTQSVSWNDFLATGTSENQTDDNAAIIPIELTNSTGTRLERLNEDCLLKIFSCNSLTLMDMCSLAETCTRFNQITHRVFAKGYGIDCTVGRVGCEFKAKNYKTRMRLHDVHRILKNFGLHLSILSIDDYCQDVANWVGQYCDDVTLKSLKISGRTKLNNIIKPFDSIFQRVQKLTFYYCCFIETVTWFALNCSSLIELKIECSSNCTEILKCTFPNLERFTWQFPHTNLLDNSSCDDVTCEFISRHNHLKFINISHVGGSRVLHVIDSNCHELHELRLYYSAVLTFSTSLLGSLTKLKILHLDFAKESPGRQCEYIPLLEAVKSLEVMKIWSSHEDGISPEIYDVLPQLTHLRELHLTSCLVNRIPWTLLAQLRKVHLTHCDYDSPEIVDDVPNIIEQLHNLEELAYTRLIYENNLSEKEFLKICKIVERRDHVLMLKCELSSELKKYCDANRRVKLINLLDEGVRTSD